MQPKHGCTGTRFNPRLRPLAEVPMLRDSTQFFRRYAGGTLNLCGLVPIILDTARPIGFAAAGLVNRPIASLFNL
jgi:hypothetical protein